MSVSLVGVDCSTDQARIGLALAHYDPPGVNLIEVTVGSAVQPAANTIAEWLTEAGVTSLIALDAPLGWPANLARSLAGHLAGEEIDIHPNRMFRRETDRFIQETLRKTPLDVGADRIARTAHAALRLLGETGRLLNRRIPLVWSASFTGIGAIEVYPAATLTAYGMRSSEYKRPSQSTERGAIVEALGRYLDLRELTHRLLSNAHALDAVVCVLAAKDFLDGLAMPAEDRALAVREGWIWASKPRSTSMLKTTG